MKIKVSVIILFLAITLATLLTNKVHIVANDAQTIEELQNRELQMFFIDVAQGDSTLIKFDNEFMLIDAGEYSEADKVVSFLKSKNVTNLKYVVATHPHSDHIGGLSTVLNNFTVENIIMPKATTNTKTFEILIKTIKDKKINVITARANNSYNLGESEFTILSPSNEEYSDLNAYSVAIRLLYKKASFIFTGDIESGIEKEIINDFTNLNSTVLKVAHHGSNTSSSFEFLDIIKPDVCVISVGADNSYGHPNDEILNRINKVSNAVFRTDKQGTISVYTDGDILDVISSK